MIKVDKGKITDSKASEKIKELDNKIFEAFRNLQGTQTPEKQRKYQKTIDSLLDERLKLKN